MSAPPATKVSPVFAIRARERVGALLRRWSQRVMPTPTALLELVQGSMLTQAIYVAVKLRIPEALADGPRRADEVAATVDADPDATYRIMRLLASYSILSEQADGRFRLTSMGDPLRGDAPRSLRDLAVLMGHPTHWDDWSHLLEAVRTGEPSFPKQHGMGAFEYMGSNPEYGAVFGQGMGSMSNLETHPVAEAYDFRGFRTVVDVGGGAGALLAAVLQRAGSANGVLFDDRAEGFGAEATLKEAGVAGRCTISRGGLFDPPPAADGYLLKHIVHDWPEEQAVRILRNIRDSVTSDGRVLLVEFVPSKGNTKHLGKIVDLWLMLLVGGRERTPEEYAGLLHKAGFALERVIPTASSVSIVEARPR